MVCNYKFAMIWCPLLVMLVSIMLYPSLGEQAEQQPLILNYHNGQLLKGRITVNLLWYGRFTPIQRSIIVDFINSLNSSPRAPLTSVASWWKIIENYKYKGGSGSSTIVVGKQIMRQRNSLGKNLKGTHLVSLASTFKGASNAVNVIFTAKEVAVEGFCSRCGTHGSIRSMKGINQTAYIWIGNSETQCPGQCAWPFHQPIYGPQTQPLVAPNNDVGVDGMIINLATQLAGTVTNPFSTGYFQGPPTAPLEAVSACTGVFGSGAYPGYPGRVILDKVNGASYNAHGVNGRKYLLPAMWDPQTKGCKTLV